ncbi:hypothetical protein K438DRAFT_1802339 [Mycena galopus ATCC 62051]|nr:hypothetical protein K438DRAFT_1802339 [Mycena galopus ATCC 62051]
MRFRYFTDSELREILEFKLGSQERRARELEAERKAVELERKKEAEAQAALRSMGVCVAGFRWIKQSGGYRCAGGSHFVSDAQLGI